ncbi:MAG: SCO family protein [Pseudomonadota bacterium]
MKADTTQVMIAAGGVVVLGAAATAAWLTFFGAPADVTFSQGTIDARESGIGAGEFSMTTHTGQTVASTEVLDGPSLVYFGYTFCPDVCPFDVQDMAGAVDILAEEGIDVDPVFVTVDPLRDTPEQMAFFVEAMHPDMVGLTPDDETLETVKRDWKLYFQKGEVGEDPEDYLMSHSSFTYFMTPESGVVMLFRSDKQPEAMAADIKTWLQATGHAAATPSS